MAISSPGASGQPDAESHGGLPDKPNAIHAIRELMLGGEFGPGDRLPPERELADRLRVSRSSVREAIRELAAHGVLVARQGSGTYVADFTSDNLFAPIEFALNQDPAWFFHLMELRRILEPAAASTASVRLSDEDLEDLQALSEKFTSEVDSGHPDGEALVAYDEELHDRIIRATGNPLFIAMVRSLNSAARRGRQVTVKIPSTPRASAIEIATLVDALKDRDPLRASAAMMHHVHRLDSASRRALRETRGRLVDPDEVE